MREPATSDKDLAEQVLEACLALAAYGLGSGIGGHVSIRVPGERRYVTNLLDKPFETMDLDDMVELDFEGNVLSSNRQVSPGIGFHPGIYELRPDVNAVVHTHGFWVTAQSAFNRPPKIWHNLATFFHGRTAVSPTDEIAHIAPSLRPGDVAIVIPWHGAITIGSSIGEACALHHTWDYVARLDVTLDPTSAEPMPEENVAGIKALVAKANYLDHTWEMMRRKARLPMLVDG